MAQAPVNAPYDGEKVTADLKLVAMEEETMKVLEGVQLKVILYVNFIERECRNVGLVPGL